jgi:hypothetical protein
VAEALETVRALLTATAPVTVGATVSALAAASVRAFPPMTYPTSLIAIELNDVPGARSLLFVLLDAPAGR